MSVCVYESLNGAWNFLWPAAIFVLLSDKGQAKISPWPYMEREVRRVYTYVQMKASEMVSFGNWAWHTGPPLTQC